MEQENGIEPIEVMVSGNVTEASDEQFEKASESISLTVSGILTEVIFSLSENPFLHIPVTVKPSNVEGMLIFPLSCEEASFAAIETVPFSFMIYLNLGSSAESGCSNYA